MHLRDIMSEEVETISPGATVKEAREKMRQQDVRHLVVMAGDKLAAVLSDHDLLRSEETALVRDLMSGPPMTATPKTTPRQAANLLRGNHVSCLPVVDEHGKVIGIVTQSDLLDLIGKGVTRTPQAEIKRPRTWVPGR